MRRILCEGRDDVFALHGIALRQFGCTDDRAGPSSAGVMRRFRTRAGVLVEALVPHVATAGGVKQVPGKQRLGELVAKQLATAPSGARDITTVAAVFDPDASTPEAFYASLIDSIGRLSPAWSLGWCRRPGVWIARRAPADRVVLRAVHWRSCFPLDGLPDDQNLERVMSSILRAAFPRDVELVEQWLGDLTSHGRQATWKAAIHIWCAIVDPTSSPADRFFGQNAACKPWVEPVLRAASVLRDLRPLLGEP